MTPNTIIVLGAALGFVLNTLGLLGIAWRGGNVIGRIERGLEEHDKVVERHDTVFERIIHQLTDLETRVGRLEGPR